ncbi:hypothetical protein EIQ17_07660 [Xanthomonas campestris pv. campestris]
MDRLRQYPQGRRTQCRAAGRIGRTGRLSLQQRRSALARDEAFPVTPIAHKCAPTFIRVDAGCGPRRAVCHRAVRSKA